MDHPTILKKIVFGQMMKRKRHGLAKNAARRNGGTNEAPRIPLDSIRTNHLAKPDLYRAEVDDPLHAQGDEHMHRDNE